MTTVHNVIARSNVIAGASAAEARRVQSRSVTLQASDVQGMNASPVTLLPQPSPGMAYVVLGVYSSKAADAFAAGGVATVRFDDATNTAIATIPVAHFTDAAADARWATRSAQSGTPGAQSVPGAAVEITCGTAFTGSGGDVTMTVRFIEVNL